MSERVALSLTRHSGKDAFGASDDQRGYLSSAVALFVVAAITVVVLLFRNNIAQFADLGYPAIFLVCLLLNCGVFGLSPSGVVAVEMSFVFDPAFTAIIAGLGAGLGEATSFYAGVQTDAFVKPKYLNRFEGFGEIKIGTISFIASFLSGNLSDAVGVACGRLRKCFAGYLVGSTGAKVAKMLLLVAMAHAASGYFGLTS